MLLNSTQKTKGHTK